MRAATAALRGRAIKTAFPLAVSAINRAGMGPVSADISREELRRSGLRAMGEVATRLGLGDAWVVFGHTHRAGPLPGDSADGMARRARADARRVRRAPGQRRLLDL